MQARVTAHGDRRRGRRGGDLLGDPPLLRGGGPRATAGAGVRRRPVGRAHVPRPARSHRGLVGGLADPAGVHGPPRPVGGPAGVGRREAPRVVRIARSAHGGTDRRPDREPPRRASGRRRAGRRDRRPSRGEPAVRRGDDRDADRRRTPRPRGRRVARRSTSCPPSRCRRRSRRCWPLGSTASRRRSASCSRPRP